MIRARRACLAILRVAGWGALFFAASFAGQIAALYVAVQLAVWRYMTAGGGVL